MTENGVHTYFGRGSTLIEEELNNIDLTHVTSVVYLMQDYSLLIENDSF